MSDRRHAIQMLGGLLVLPATRLPAATATATATAKEAAPHDIQQILAASDTVRNPSTAFSTLISVTEYRNRRVEDEGRIIVLAQPNRRVGQYDSLVRIVQPSRDRGKMMLKTAEGNEVWFYDPASKSGMRISLQQRLLGQAANGDVVSVNLAGAYQGSVVGTETIRDGDRQQRECLRLQLSSDSRSVTYPSLRYWVDRVSKRPVKAEFHADSGRLLKTAYYRRYRKTLGEERPTEVVILDAISSSLVTVLRYSAYKADSIPASWFTREGLSSIPAIS